VLGLTAHSVDIAIYCDDCEPLSIDDDTRRYGPAYDRARKIVIERDNHSCQGRYLYPISTIDEPSFQVEILNQQF